MDVITSGSLSSLLLEGLKFIIRRIKKNPEYDFPVEFYAVALAVLNVLVIPLLVWLGIPGYAMPTDFMSYIRTAVIVLISSLISVLVYNTGIKPTKHYARNFIEARRAKRLLRY